jgi:LysM repeat protein
VWVHDAAGNRHPCEERDTYLGNHLEVDRPGYTETVTDGNASTTFAPYDVLRPPTLKTSRLAVTERYSFDAQNRLKEVTRDDIRKSSSLSYNGDHVTAAAESSTPFVMERRRYDALGQLLEVGNPERIHATTIRKIYGLAPGETGNAPPSIGDDLIRMEYDSLGRMQRQQTWSSEHNFMSLVSYAAADVTPIPVTKFNLAQPPASPPPNGYDAVGNALQYTVFAANGAPASTYRMDYVHRDGALVSTTTGYRKDKDTTRSNSTLKTYDGNGHIRSVIDPDDAKSDQTRYFNTDASGTVLRSVQVGAQRPEHLNYTFDAQGNRVLLPQATVGLTGPQANEQFQLVAAGQVLGRYGEMVNPDAPRDKDNKLQFIVDSDFNTVFKSVNDGAAQGTSTYTVAKGDTLQSIARAQLGDEDLWFTIAQANGLADSAGLEEGQVLRIPAVIVTSTNNDDGTFEAYDPTAIIGDATPVIPQPPKKKKNILKQIIIVVAAVVITIYTAGALSGFTGGFVATMQAGLGVMGIGAGVGAGAAGAFGAAGSFLGTAGTLAVAGAAGSIGSQLVGMALGEQDKFSWRQVGLSALGGYIGGKLPVSLPGLSKLPIANAVVKGAISNALSQGIGYATGLQDSFSWRAVAASAITAGVTKGVGDYLGGGANWQNNANLSDFSKFAIDAGSRFVGGTVAQAVTNKGGRVNFGQVAADAFGNALGNSIVGQINRASQQEQRAGFIRAGADMMGPEGGIWGQPQTWQPAHRAQPLPSASVNLDDVEYIKAVQAAEQKKAEEDWARATRPLMVAGSMNGVDMANYRLNPRGVVAGATQGITSLLTSSQYGLTADLSSVEKAQAASERDSGLASLRTNWQSVADDAPTRSELMRLAADHFGQDGVRQRGLLGQVELAAGIIKAGDPTNVAEAANLATALGTLRRNPFAVALLSATLADSRDSVTAAVNHLADSSALEYNGGRAWNFATARDIASGTLGGLVPLVGVGSRAISRAWTDLNRSIPDMRQNPFPPELSRGSPVRVTGGTPIRNDVLNEPRIGNGEKGQGSGNKLDQLPNQQVVGTDGKPIPVYPVKPNGPYATQEFPSTPVAHGFPDIVDNYVNSATKFPLNNGASLLQVPGSYNGVAGRFEWIIDPRLGGVTHRMFVPSGTINGIPVKQ